MSDNTAFLELVSFTNKLLTSSQDPPQQEPDMAALLGIDSSYKTDPDPRPSGPIEPLPGTKRRDPKFWKGYCTSRLIYYQELRAWVARREAALMDAAWEAALKAPPGASFQPDLNPQWIRNNREELAELAKWLRGEGIDVPAAGSEFEEIDLRREVEQELASLAYASEEPDPEPVTALVPAPVKSEPEPGFLRLRVSFSMKRRQRRALATMALITLLFVITFITTAAGGGALLMAVQAVLMGSLTAFAVKKRWV
jgi:hypothetical protein